jgi:hypothetical protein
MKKMILIVTFFSLLSTLSAQNYNPVERKLNWLNDLEVLIRLDTQKESTLRGRDINNNGVRDDVETYIETKFGKDPFQKTLFMEAARKIQQIITLPRESSVEEHLALDKALLRLYTCRDYILYRDDEENIEQEMLNKTLFKAKVLNTEERLVAYIEHKKKLPFEFEDLNSEELQIEKKECLARYNRFKNQDAHAALFK